MAEDTPGLPAGYVDARTLAPRVPRIRAQEESSTCSENMI